MLEMPSMSRVATLLATLSPGVLQQDQNQNIAHLWSHDAASQFTVDGGRNNTRSNTFELDGMPNLKTGGQIAYMPPPDSIQEVAIVMNAYDSSIGRQAGGTIQMTLKSGTSKLHGSLYDFNQNNVLNAMQFQTEPVPAATKRRCTTTSTARPSAGRCGFPKVYNGKQKTFFFFNYNGIRNSDPRFGIRSLPTELEREGDFSQSYTTQVVERRAADVPDSGVRSADREADANGTRTLFPGMRIPANRISNVAKNILGYVPLPNTPSDGTSNATQQLRAELQPREQDGERHHPRRPCLEQQPQELRDGPLVSRGRAERRRVPQRLHGRVPASDDARLGHRPRMDAQPEQGPGPEDEPDAVRRAEQRSRRRVRPGHARDAGVVHVAQFVPAAPRITGLFGDIGTNQAGNVAITGYYTLVGRDDARHRQHDVEVRRGVLGAAAGQQGHRQPGPVRFRQRVDPQLRAGGRRDGRRFDARRPSCSACRTTATARFPWNADKFWSQHFAGFFVQNDWRVTPQADPESRAPLGFRDADHGALQPRDVDLRSQRREPDQRGGAGGLLRTS